MAELKEYGLMVTSYEAAAAAEPVIGNRAVANPPAPPKSFHARPAPGRTPTDSGNVQWGDLPSLTTLFPAKGDEPARATAAEGSSTRPLKKRGPHITKFLPDFPTEADLEDFDVNNARSTSKHREEEEGQGDLAMDVDESYDVVPVAKRARKRVPANIFTRPSGTAPKYDPPPMPEVDLPPSPDPTIREENALVLSTEDLTALKPRVQASLRLLKESYRDSEAVPADSVYACAPSRSLGDDILLFGKKLGGFFRSADVKAEEPEKPTAPKPLTKLESPPSNVGAKTGGAAAKKKASKAEKEAAGVEKLATLSKVMSEKNVSKSMSVMEHVEAWEPPKPAPQPIGASPFASSSTSLVEQPPLVPPKLKIKLSLTSPKPSGPEKKKKKSMHSSSSHKATKSLDQTSAVKVPSALSNVLAVQQEETVEEIRCICDHPTVDYDERV
ncbi:hypothetical protein HK101_000562 [Irineochytrium annulatum]|nr:hypothetical protein HK101_000562 [Irineochytrium annulatum]